MTLAYLNGSLRRAALDVILRSRPLPGRLAHGLKRMSFNHFIHDFSVSREEAKNGVAREMALTKAVFAVLAAALVSGCAASSFGDPMTGPLPPKSISPQQAGPQANGTSSTSDPQRDEGAVRKIAMNLTAVSDPESKSYKIGPHDVLEITVFQAPELSKTIQVSEAGSLNFPLIGEVEASGRSAREVEQELRKRLQAKYLQNPQVSVYVKDHFSQRVTLEGNAKKPGVYPIAGGLTLLQLIAQAGGFDETASKTVMLFRQVDGKRFAAQYDVSAIRNGNAEDIQLQAGDVVIIPSSDLREGMNLFFKAVPLMTLVPYL